MAEDQKPASPPAPAAGNGSHSTAGALRPRGRTLVILGNGPSLAGFDFARLRAFDAIGMNAAYRYWDQIGWYPRYYVCLDAVVGQSHKSAIERLIRERDNGIELFVLRQELVAGMPEDVRRDDRVLLFEHLRETSPHFSPMPFTTGSHAALVGAWLGYERMLLMGIDCNYVEKIEAAEEKGANVLRIRNTPEKNPNYFFEGYQQQGDQYTVPNPIPDLHLRCWRDVLEVLAKNRIAAWNGSAISRIDFIPFRSFDEVELEDREAAHLEGEAQKNGPTAFVESELAATDAMRESAVLATLLSERKGDRHVFLGIGADAHASCGPFRRLGWRVLCFEPESGNPAKLRKGASDTTTIAEIAIENGLAQVDVLRADDVRTLKAVPWNRIEPAVVHCRLENEGASPFPYTHRDMAEFLVGLGYAVYVAAYDPARRGKTPEDWVKKYPAQSSPEGLGSVLAFRIDPGEAALERAFRACLTFGGLSDMLAKSPVAQQPDEQALADGFVVRTGRTPARDIVEVSAAGYLRWTGNFTRRHPLVAAGFAFFFVALLAGSAFPAAQPHRLLLWGLAETLLLGWGLATGVGYAGTLARKVDRGFQRQREATMNALQRGQRQMAATDRRLAAIDRHIAAADQRLAATDRRIAEVAEEIAKISRALTDVVQLARTGKTSAERAEAASAALSAKLTEASRLLSELKADNARSVAELKAALRRMEVAAATLSAKITDVSRASEDAKAAAARAENAAKVLQASSAVYNFGRFRTFNRTLTDDQIEVLKTVWTRRLSVSAETRTLGYAAHRICTFESSMQGRLATSIEDILLRAMVGRAAGQKLVSVLEIGTLFGIGAIAVIDAIRRDGKDAHLTVIDPLEGYYGRATDIVTGQVVSEAVFRDNLRIAGIPDSDVTIIKRMSASPESIAEAGKREYDLLIVDGDHSYAGVKGDFENYASFVRLGGFVIFDDYGTGDWPDVKRFVDTEMPNHPRYTLVGAEWRTAVFRAITPAVAVSEEEVPVGQTPSV